jgi:hypothetical protein
MKIDIKGWWGQLTAPEQKGVIVFGSFIVGVTILLSGIHIGQLIGMVINR